MTPPPQAAFQTSNAGLTLLLREMQDLAQVIPTLVSPRHHAETAADRVSNKADREQQFDNMAV